MGFLVSPVQKALSSLIKFLSFFFFLRLFVFFCCFVSCHNMASNDDLKKAFMNFANQGKSGAQVQELDNKNWTKMAKDCGLYNKTCTSTDGDITFQKFCGNKAKHITFDVFLKFIDELASKYYKGDANAVEKYRGQNDGRLAVYRSAQGKVRRIGQRKRQRRKGGCHRQRWLRYRIQRQRHLRQKMIY